MNTDERVTLVDELLHSTQVIRKNIMTDGRRVLDGAFVDVFDQMTTDEEADDWMARLFPYLFGPNNIMQYLILLSLRSEPPTGMEVYNLLTVAHRLDKTGAIHMAYNAYIRPKELPEPVISMCMEGI